MAYKILKVNEEDFNQSLIQKDNVKIEFTLEGADARQRDYKKQETEWSSQISLCESIIKNVKENHPDIFDLPEEKRVACKLVLENEALIGEIAPKLDQLQKAIKRYEKERAQIMKQFNWKDHDEGGEGTAE
jgi:hypothetical protein